MQSLLSNPPHVQLVDWTAQPYELSVAAARTCYSSRGIVSPEDVSRTKRSRALRDRIAESTLEAGHLTTRQHAHLVFALDRVSRAAIWSFLHSHPFYNSEQVSQRYVETQPENVAIPPLEEKPLGIYKASIREQMECYQQLIDLLMPTVREEYFRIFPARRKQAEQLESTMVKRAYEVARYVLPVAAHAYLYHTVSMLTLYRYARLADYFDVPLEQRLIIQQMVAAVKEVDPLSAQEFLDPIPIDQTPEYQWFANAQNDAPMFVEEFDAELEGHTSKLVDHSSLPEATMAAAVRQVLGIPRPQLDDAEALALVLHPDRNPYFAETLNLTTLTKLTRTMVHPYYTFQKKISHTADSQDQRHRTVPASRPVLASHYTGQPDYIVPRLISHHSQAQEVYEAQMRSTFAAINQLLDLGVAHEHAFYLLPNAVPIRFTESGSLLDLHHKWRMRLCYNAQEEIFYASVDEVQQIEEVHPAIGSCLRAPCWFRAEAGVRPYCPEGDRFCGSAVWKLPLGDYERLI